MAQPNIVDPIQVASSGVQIPIYTPPAKVLVLGCIDPRFAGFLEWFLVHQSQIFGQYDLFTLAGASLGFNQSLIGQGNPSAGLNFSGNAWDGGVATGNYENNATFLHWDEVFLNHLDIAESLHQITDVWIFDHLDCGAYKIIKFNDPTLAVSDLDILAHSDEIARMACHVAAHSPALKVKGFVMNTTGDIFKVYDDRQGGMEFSPPGSSSSNWWVLPTVLGSLVLVYIYLKYSKKIG
jgi:hypothetical protein